MTDDTRITVSLVLPVKPGRIFDVLATPYRLSEIDPTGATVSDANASPVTAEGQVFTMNMVASNGRGPATYQAEHRVDAFRNNRLIGWRVHPAGGDPAGWSWRFELVPIEGKKKRTEVVVTCDWSETSPENAVRFAPARTAADLEAALALLANAVKK